MLNPDQDRLDYGQMLSPPEGYRLDFAVGTTYSLDLDALVGACIALGLSEETDSALLNNPICLLEALRSTGDKVAIFCEGGQIHLPNKVTPLYILLENMVFQVSPEKKRQIKGYPAFHPKFWLLRYVNDAGEKLYRICILSRNLTFDRSWDVTFYMDGHIGNKVSEKTKPVCEFLNYLGGYAGEKQQAVLQLAQELKRVNFELEGKEFYDFDFIPMGIKERGIRSGGIAEYPLFKESFRELLIMSPFLTGSVINGFNDRAGNAECVLITRAASLGRLRPPECSRFRIYTLKDAVVDGESIISEDPAEVMQQDIHAKVYMTRRYYDVDLYLGSMNVSYNAMNGNVEFMVRLRTKYRYLNLEKLTQQLFCGAEGDAGNPFQTVQMAKIGVGDIGEDPQSILDRVIKELVRKKPRAQVIQTGECYEVHIHFGRMESVHRVEISPLLISRPALFAENMVFADMTIKQLSEFYRVTVSDGDAAISRVIRIPTDGMPDGREKAVVTDVVRDKDCFYRYIAFLLGDDHVLSAVEGSQLQMGNEQGNANHYIGLHALYEKMLKTAASNPAKLREIGDLIRIVGKDGVVPEQFAQLYDVFREAVGLDG